MIEFKNISKSFKNNFWEKDNFVLNDVSFKINQGDLIGFLGANGAGKTTLIKILMGFTTKFEGEVIFSKNLGQSFSEIKSNIGFLPERPYLYPHLTGREYLDFLKKLVGHNEIDDKKVEVYSKKLSIDYALDKKIETYSKGMQQRLGFLGAIMHFPKLIVLDEPLSGLDPLGRREFKKIFQELNKVGTTILFTSHVVSDVEEICNRVIFIEGSKLMYEGSVRQLVNKHSSNKFKVKYLENNREEERIDQIENKNKVIKELIDTNCEIVSVEDEKISLEEIIYKIKK